MTYHKMLFVAIFMAVFVALPASAALESSPVAYEVEGESFEGYLAWDSALEGPLPTVLVVHEWWGLDDFARRAADRLAELGYAAIAVDMYGVGQHTDDPEEAGAWAGAVRNNPDVLGPRFAAAMDAVRELEQVDASRMAAMGYCFGGTVVLEAARLGLELRGVISFHGGLGSNVPEDDYDLQGSVLVLHGAADPLVSDSEVAAFIEEMRQAEADWQLNYYSGAKHSFTNPKADEYGMDATGYNPKTAQRSWGAMQLFLDEVLAE